MLLLDMNRTAEAEPLIRRALAIAEKSLSPDNPSVANSLNNLAGLLGETNRLAEAEPLFRRALSILVDFTHTAGHQHPRLESVRASYAQALRELGRSEAEVDAALKSVQEARRRKRGRVRR
jgi:tetratricopeptide (TPR) repeat protein